MLDYAANERFWLFVQKVTKYLFGWACMTSIVLNSVSRFSERGKIFAKQEVRAIQPGPGGIFFTGDGTGLVRVWKWAESSGQQ